MAPGTNSFEKWLRLKIDDADGQVLSGFWVSRTGDLPDGVTVKLGVTDTPATPVATESAVARETMAAGRRYWFDMGELDADNDVTRYLVIQEQTVMGADTGSVPQGDWTFGWAFQQA